MPNKYDYNAQGSSTATPVANKYDYISQTPKNLSTTSTAPVDFSKLTVSPVQPSLGQKIQDFFLPQPQQYAPTLPEQAAGKNPVDTSLMAPVRAFVQGAIDAWKNTPTQPKDFSGGGFEKAFGESVQQGFANLDKQVAVLSNKQSTGLQDINALGEVATGSFGAMFGVLTSPLQGYASIPVVGDFVDLINKTFAAIGGGGKEYGLNVLSQAKNNGLISQSTVDTLTPFVGDASSLLAQLAAGKAMDVGAGTAKDVYTKLADNSKAIITELGKDPIIQQKIAELTKPPPEPTLLQSGTTGKAPIRLPTEQSRTSIALPETNPEALKALPAGNPDNPVQGEGFSMANKADTSKVALGKAMNTYNEALAKHIDRPTPTTLAKVLKARDALKTLQETPVATPKFERSAKAGIAGKQKFVSKPTPKEPTISPIQPSDIKTTETPKITGAPPEVKVPASQLPVGTGETKVSRLEARVTDNLDNLTPEKIQELGLSTYSEMKVPAQKKAAIDYVIKNPDHVLPILKGEMPAPKGILKESIFVAADALGHEDVALGRKLASLSATRSGQGLRMLAEVNPHSPVKIASEIVKARSEFATKKGLSLDKETASLSKEVAKAKKTTRSSRPTWEEFTKSLACNY